MVKAVPIQPSFSRGELSPRLSSRVDLTMYATGLETCRNWVVLPHGGLTVRPGTRFVAEVKDSTKNARLLPFEFSTEEAYVIVAGDRNFRFMRDGGSVFVEDTDAAVVNGGFDTDLTGWTVGGSVSQSEGAASFSATGTLTQSVTVTTADKEVALAFKVTGSAGNFLTLRVGTTAGASDILEDTDCQAGFHTRAFTPGEGNETFHIRFLFGAGTPGLDDVRFIDDMVVEVGSPYGHDDLSDLHYTQSADILYLAHKDYPPRRLSRTGHASWSLEEIAFTGQPADWEEENYPRVVGFYEDRLGWGSTPGQPQTLWFSRTGDFEDLTVGSDDDDGLEFTISAGQVNAIRWIAEDQQLQIGTSGATRTLAGAGVDAALTPNSVKGKRHTTFGSAAIQPVQTGAVTLFIGRNRRRIREFVYSFDVDRFVSPDLSLLSEHMTRSGIREIAYAQDPDSIIWMCLNDGQLVGMTYERDQDVVAWHRHHLGGATETTDYAFVESVVVVPGKVRDEPWLIVRRNVNGTSRRYIEYLSPVFDSVTISAGAEEAFFVDSGLSYVAEKIPVTAATNTSPVVVTAAGHGFPENSLVHISDVEGMEQLNGPTWQVRNVTADMFELFDSGGTAVNGAAFPAYVSGGTARLLAASVQGLDHIEGEVVSILGDAAVYPSQTVTDGAVSLANGGQAAVIHVGLPYKAVVRTLRPEAGAADGTSQGRRKRIHKVVVRLRDTLGLKIGRNESELDVIPFRRAGDPMDSAPPFFEGEKSVSFNGGWDSAGQVTVVQDQPLPAHLLAIIPHLTTTED
ncbi:MAG: ubiquitin-activating E1 FCCH domain-containing protein [Rhodospirillales bacterium]